MKTKNRKKSCLKILLIAGLGLTGLCLALALVSALLNSRMPKQSAVVDRLSELEKARLMEVLHLRQTFGDQVMPGWSQVEIPLVVYNEAYAFLVGTVDPQDGWYKVPRGPQRGSPWEPVPGDDFMGEPYYRQQLQDPQVTPEAFTVKIGELWAASLPTFEWFRIEMVQHFREDLPGPLKQVFPYSITLDLFLDSGDLYMAAILHESFHAYQGLQAPGRLAAAEAASIDLGRQYPWENETLNQDWQVELKSLQDGIRAGTVAEAAEQARAFLEQRKRRRQSANLSASLVDLERNREWEEGLAKYAELSMYRLAAKTAGYAPVPELSNDPDFRQYQHFGRRWTNEVNQISLSINSEDIRFYYTGMAQAVLLDRLMPAWKERLFEEGVWLEDLLAEAVQQVE